MGQVTLYLDDETHKAMRAEAERAGLSMSAWLSSLVRERTSSVWPADVVALSGAWPDAPDPDELRNPNALDVPREVL